MKKLIFALVAVATLFASEVSPALKSLLHRFDIEASESEEIVRATQRLWLRKPGQERWDLPDFSPNDRAGILADLSAFGLIEEISPREKAYDYCLVLGAAIPTMERRLEYLGDLWRRGLRFGRLVFLASDRRLCLEGDRTAPTENYRNEMEALLFLYKKSSREIPVDIVLATRESGRPNTADTIHAWLEKNPRPGSLLAISTQPYVKYQDAILRALLPKDFGIETVGPQAPENLNIALALDACARTLYVDLEIEKKMRYDEPYEKPRNRPGSAEEHTPRK